MARQGPHHSAQKSTSTGRSLVTTPSNVPSVTCTMALVFVVTTESLEEDDVNGLVRHDIHQRRIHGHIRDGSPDSGDEARADPRRRRAESLADRGLLLSLEGLDVMPQRNVTDFVAEHASQGGLVAYE